MLRLPVEIKDFSLQFFGKAMLSGVFTNFHSFSFESYFLLFWVLVLSFAVSQFGQINKVFI